MSSPNAKIVISAIDETKKGINDAKKNIQNLAKDVAGIDLKKAFSIAGVVAGTTAAVKAVGKAVKDCSKEFLEANDAAVKFNSVWRNVGAVTGRTSDQVMKLADNLELSSNFTAESVLEAGQLLAATQKLSKEGFDRAIQASADLAASMGTDVTNAAQTLAKALSEPEKGLQSLKTAGVTFTDSEKDLIKKLQEEGNTWEAQELILQKVEDRYQGVAKAINSTPLGTMNNIEDVLGNIKESFGEAFVNAISPALEDIYDWLLKIKEWIDNYNEEAKNIRNQQAIKAAVGSGDISKLTTDQYQLALDTAAQEIATYEASLAELERNRYRYGEQVYKSSKAALESSIANARAVMDNIEAAKKDAINARKKAAASNKANALAMETMFDPVYKAFDQTAYNIEQAAKAIGSDTYKAWSEGINEKYKNYNRYEGVLDAFGNYAPNIDPATLGGRTTTHLPSVEVTLANPEEVGNEISTPVANALKATDEAIEYATSSTMMDRWKAMTVAGQRQMTQLGIDASAKFKEVSTPIADRLKAVDEAIAYATSSTMQARWEKMTIAGQRQMTALGIDPTPIKPVEIVIANPEEISTPITDRLKATDEAIEYATSSTMMERWKKMTIAGQRQMTQLGIDATPQAELQMERWKAMTVAGQKQMDDLGITMRRLESVLEETAVQGSYKDIAGIQWKSSGEEDVFIEAISNMIDMLDGAAGALADLVASAGPLGIIIWMLNEVFGAFMSQLNSLINDALAPFVEVLHWIGQELANVFAPILDLVGRWLALIGNILQTVLGPVISLIAAPLKMIAGILDILTPVLEALAKTFVVLLAPVQWIADLFMWVGDVIQTFVHNLTHPFDKKSYAKFSESVGANAFTDIQNKTSTIDNIGGGYGELVTTGSSSTGLANASYQGGGSITITINQMAPVVGDGGMQQFAKMIRAEFEELQYFGA